MFSNLVPFKNYTCKNCFQILVVIKFLSFLLYCHLLFDVLFNTHTLTYIKIWKFRLTWTIYKRIMQIGWVFFFSYYVEKTFWKGNKIWFIVFWFCMFFFTNIIHPLRSQNSPYYYTAAFHYPYFFLKNISTRYKWAKASARQDLMNTRTTSGVTAVLKFALYKIAQCRWSCWKAALLDNFTFPAMIFWRGSLNIDLKILSPNSSPGICPCCV